MVVVMGWEENCVQKDILKFLNRLPGCKAWRSNQIPVKGRTFVGLKGVSDIIGCYKGLFLAVEAKTIDGKLRPEQEQFLNDIRLLGGIAIEAHCLSDVFEVFSKMGVIKK